MRFRFVWLLVAFTVVVAQPCAAQDRNDAARAKRIAEIQKELQELQSRIAKLNAELSKLQPPVKPGPPDLAPTDKTMKGTILSLNDQHNEFYLVNGGPKNDKLQVGLTEDARIVFSDMRPAKLTDLMPGQEVTFRYRFVTATKSKPATLIYESDFVIISKAKGDKGEKR